MGDRRINLYGLSGDELRKALDSLDGPASPPYRSGQIYRWIYKRELLRPNDWTDLPGDLRGRIEDRFRVDPGTISGRAEAEDGTVKYRILLQDGNEIEAVYMVHGERITLCLSSQCGCALGCSFCLTGKMGLRRNLSAGEILGQVHLIREDRRAGDLPCNVVFMGMGEPLHNYEGVAGAVRLLTDPGGAGWSRKRITVSTAGMVPGILRLAEEPIRPRLAVSLNATTDQARDRLMPVNRKYPLKVLLDACARFTASSRDRVTFEYVLLEGVNDSPEDMRRLAALVRGQRAKLNLIPFNPVPGWLDFRSPPREAILESRDRLLDLQTPVSVRWSRGGDARAACGQLAMLEGSVHSPANRQPE